MQGGRAAGQLPWGPGVSSGGECSRTEPWVQRLLLPSVFRDGHCLLPACQRPKL